MAQTPQKTRKERTQLDTLAQLRNLPKSKGKKAFTRADAFLLFEATGIEQSTTPILLNHQEKLLIKDLLIKELQQINEDDYSFEDDKLLKQSLLSKYYENRKMYVEQVYVKLHE